jgi:hypothetical protein
MDFKSQQRVANMLYRDHENRKYLFWAINSVVMQVCFYTMDSTQFSNILGNQLAGFGSENVLPASATYA